ncbi:MAG: signal recognition particle protein [Legionellales bacterium]|nr:signal recognition particle protein [Legionellales bacterium]
MFQQLSQRISDVFRSFTGTDKITDAMLQQGAVSLRNALRDADVAESVTDQLLQQFNEKALNQAVVSGAKASDVLVKLFHDNLIEVLGKDDDFSLKLSKKPAIIMLVGLQGAGKTTFAARLAKQLKKDHSSKCLLTSLDVYRPAAMDQLATLAQQADVDCFPATPDQTPDSIAKNAMERAKSESYDVLILDTAGRMHVNDDMMAECRQLQQVCKPCEILFVIDSMTGQDAANNAKAFNDQLALTGAVLTKTDGDSRGGAALSVRQVTGKPIKYMTTGEHLDDLDNFQPERIASQILGMGDIVSLVKQFENKVDQEKTKKMAKKLLKSGDFDFNDLAAQLEQMASLGGMKGILSKLPNLGGQLPMEMLEKKLDSASFDHIAVMIRSMTPQERAFPTLVMNVKSRQKRIMSGSGRSQKEFKAMLKQFQRMQKMAAKFKGKNMMNMMGKMSDLFGGQR